MKFKNLFLAMLALSVVFVSCKKEEEDDDSNNKRPDLKESYFSIQGATYNPEAIPDVSGDGPSITDLQGNLTVLAGGSSPITIESETEASNVLIGVEGADGYYTYPATSKNLTYYLYLLFTQEITGDFTILFFLQNANGQVGDPQTIMVSTYEAGTGKFQINLSWDQPNDMDLHLFEPDGTEIYFGNSVSGSGGELDVDSNAACSIDGINNENITYGDNAVIAAGTYRVVVDRWGNCDVSKDTRWSVTLTLNGQLVEGNNPVFGSWSEDYTEDEDQTVLEVTITPNMMKSAKRALKLNYGKFQKEIVLSPEKL